MVAEGRAHAMKGSTSLGSYSFPNSTWRPGASRLSLSMQLEPREEDELPIPSGKQAESRGCS